MSLYDHRLVDYEKFNEHYRLLLDQLLICRDIEPFLLMRWLLSEIDHIVTWVSAKDPCDFPSNYEPSLFSDDLNK